MVSFDKLPLSCEDLKTGALILGATYGTFKLLTSMHWHYKHYQQNKKAAYPRDPVFPPCLLKVALSEQDRQLILNCKDAVSLSKLIVNERKVSCKQAVRAHAERCFQFGRSHNLLASEHYEQALAEADSKDRELQEAIAKGTQGKLPPFFGVPVSIKDQIAELNKPLSSGSTWMMAHFKATEDAVVVTLLKKAGAICMVRGNLPQYMLVADTNNRVYGQAMNPYDKARTCGGSSGGDGGLVAANCVPLAVGTDIGGSIRIPAHCTGVLGFKPTPQRSSTKGQKQPCTNYCTPQHPIMSASGPICKSVDDILAFQKIIFTEALYKLDPNIAPLVWRESEYKKVVEKKSLRIGYICHETGPGKFEDGFENIPISKATKRILAEAKSKITQAGHTLVPLVMNKSATEDLYLTYVGITGFYSMAGIKALYSHYEKPLDLYMKFVRLTSLPNWLISVLTSLAKLTGQPRMAARIPALKTNDKDTIDKLYLQREKFKFDTDMQWEDLKLDCCISPAMYHAAFKISEAHELATLADYTMMQNYLNYPAGVIPAGVVQKEDLASSYLDETKYRDQLGKSIARSEQGSEGMPICLQVLTRQWCDEECIAAMKVIDDALGNQRPQPQLKEWIQFDKLETQKQ